MPAAPRVKLPTRTGGGGGAVRSPASPGRFGPRRAPADPVLRLAQQQKRQLSDTEMGVAQQLDADWQRLVAVPLAVELTHFANRYQQALDALLAQQLQQAEADAETDDGSESARADGGGFGGGGVGGFGGPRGPDAVRRGVGGGGASFVGNTGGAQPAPPPPRVPTTWLLDRNGGDAPRVLRGVKEQIGKFAQSAQPVIAQGVASAQTQGTRAAETLLGALLQPGLSALDEAGAEGDAANLLKMTTAAARDDAQFALLQNLLQSGSQLGMLLGGMPQEAADQAYRTLIYGLGHGENPKALVSDLQQILQSPRNRALTISRTEMMNSYRRAQIDAYRANDGVVNGWVWSSDMASACPLCVDLNGEIHPLDDDMVSHPRCRCSPLPITKSWDDILGPLGIDSSDIEDTTLNLESGEDWFARQDEATQRAVLGPSAFNAYQGGALQLSDLVGRNSDGSYYQKSLKEVGLDANAWLGKGRNAGVPVRVEIPGGGYTYVTPGPLAEEVPQFNTADRAAGWQSIDEEMSNLRAFSPDAAGGAGGGSSSYELTEDDKAFVQSIRDQIPAGGITTSDDAIALGDQVRARVEDNLSELRGYAQEAQGIRERAPNLTDEERAWAMGDPKAVEAHGGYHVFGKNSAEWAYQDRYQAQMRAYLGETREVGGEVNINTEHGAYDPRVGDAVRNAMQNMPSDWLRASNDLGELYVGKSLERSNGGWFTRLDNGRDGSLAIRYTKGTGDAQIESTALHEMTHRMEMTLQKLGDIEAQFYDARTAGEAFTALTNGIRAKTKLDDWLEEYLGREPLHFFVKPEQPLPNGETYYMSQSYELLTMGAEMLFASGVDMSTFALWRDPQYVSFVLGVFLGVQA